MVRSGIGERNHKSERVADHPVFAVVEFFRVGKDGMRESPSAQICRRLGAGKVVIDVLYHLMFDVGDSFDRG